MVLGYDQVYTNLQFVHIPTVPLEERPAFDRKSPFARLKEEGVVPEDASVNRPQDLDSADVIASYKVQEQLVFLPGGAKQFDRHTVAASWQIATAPPLQNAPPLANQQRHRRRARVRCSCRETATIVPWYVVCMVCLQASLAPRCIYGLLQAATN